MTGRDRTPEGGPES